MRTTLKKSGSFDMMTSSEYDYPAGCGGGRGRGGDYMPIGFDVKVDAEFKLDNRKFVTNHEVIDNVLNDDFGRAATEHGWSLETMLQTGLERISKAIKLDNPNAAIRSIELELEPERDGVSMSLVWTPESENVAAVAA